MQREKLFLNDNILVISWCPWSLWAPESCRVTLLHLPCFPLCFRIAELALQQQSCNAGCERAAESDLVYSRVVTQVDPDCSFITVRHVVCVFLQPTLPAPLWPGYIDGCLSGIWSDFLPVYSPETSHAFFFSLLSTCPQNAFMSFKETWAAPHWGSHVSLSLFSWRQTTWDRRHNVKITNYKQANKGT